jgi:chemotaxis protein methyltransferase CheR
MAAPLVCPDLAAANRLDTVPSLFDRAACLRILHAEAMPRLRSYPAPRVWLAECTHPEDVLALSVLLAEHGLHERTQVYATAADSAQLARARAGTVSLARLADCASAYHAAGGTRALDEFVLLQEGHARSRDPDDIVWAQHDLSGDASFNEFDLIVCARPLADLGAHLQRRVLDLFAGSLPLLGMLWVSAPNPALALPRFAGVAPAAGLYRRCV